jgi:1-acyl-sn-glycerol-3-phosphate acyltransferase
MSNLMEKILFGASRFFIGLFIKIFLKLDVHQKSAFPAGAKIIAPNHPSICDPFFMASIIHEQSYILITDIAFQLPLFGIYLRGLGHIPVVVGRGQEAMDAALKHLKNGDTIMIFPEGTNSPAEGGYEKERSGVARLAIESGAPVYPVGINLDRGRLLRFKSKGIKNLGHTPTYLHGPYNVTIGKPMRFVGDVEDRQFVRDSAHQIMEKIIRLAYESKQRWIRNTKPATGALETT